MKGTPNTSRNPVGVDDSAANGATERKADKDAYFPGLASFAGRT